VSFQSNNDFCQQYTVNPYFSFLFFIFHLSHKISSIPLLYLLKKESLPSVGYIFLGNSYRTMVCDALDCSSKIISLGDYNVDFFKTTT
jgi:hypothetical protein